MYSTGFSMYRTAQRRVRSRLRAYWATRGERTRDPARLRERLRLSKKSLEYAAYADLNAAPHLRRHITKALAMNLADSVWAAAERHLFPDATGKRFGMPGVGRWYDFRRLPGRAQSHTEEHKWESFRLHGTLAGHRAAYRSTSGRFFQPRRMRPVAEPKSWWRYEGPLALVFSGLPDGTLILPIRLPSAPSNQAILDHHLGDPSKWHKIDLVRTRDPSVLGGWRYEAHLMVLAAPYASPATRAAREAAAIAGTGRCGGIDVNVSNVTIASHENEDDLRVTRVVRGAKARTRAHRRARQERRRLRALDRSRRAANAAQYELSKRQAKRARRREAAGLRPVQVIPAGPRKAGSDGKPLQAYWRDTLTQGYRRKRAERAAAAASAARARKADARTTAKRVVAEHGFRFVVEDVSPRTWFKRWGRALAAATPGMLVSAIEHEANVVAAIANQRGGLARASTRTTTLSQHCLCGHRVAKELGQRRHTCDLRPPRRSRHDRRGPRRSCRVRHPERASLGTRRLRGHANVARAVAEQGDRLPDPVESRYRAARRPVRVKRNHRPGRILRHGNGVLTRPGRGGSANRWWAPTPIPDEFGPAPDHAGSDWDANQPVLRSNRFDVGQLLADQWRRAAMSVPLNIAEAVGKTSGADRANRFMIARGEAMECGAIVDVVRILEAVPDADSFVLSGC
jgi:hypothetical protein